MYTQGNKRSIGRQEHSASTSVATLTPVMNVWTSKMGHVILSSMKKQRQSILICQPSREQQKGLTGGATLWSNSNCSLITWPILFLRLPSFALPPRGDWMRTRSKNTTKGGERLQHDRYIRFECHFQISNHLRRVWGRWLVIDSYVGR